MVLVDFRGEILAGSSIFFIFVMKSGYVDFVSYESAIDRVGWGRRQLVWVELEVGNGLGRAKSGGQRD